MTIEVILVLVILGGSVVLQFWAAGIALSLIGRVGLRNNWLLISLAIGLMAARRLVSLSHAWTVRSGDIQTILAEIIAFATSGLLVMGLYNLHPHVRSLLQENDSLSELTEELREKNSQLQKFNSFIARSLHVLTRQSLSQVTRLQNSADPPAVEKKQEILKNLHGECETINDLANGLLVHIKAAGDGKHKESVYFSSLLSEMADTAAIQNRIDVFNLQIDDDLFIEADPYLLRSFSENLIRLAIKSHLDGVSASLVEEHSSPYSYYRFTVRGKPLSETEIQNLYSPFSGLSNYHDLEKRGLELSILASIVHHYGGRIWLDSEKTGIFSINFTFTERHRH